MLAEQERLALLQNEDNKATAVEGKDLGGGVFKKSQVRSSSRIEWRLLLVHGVFTGAISSSWCLQESFYTTTHAAGPATVGPSKVVEPASTANSAASSQSAPCCAPAPA